ncbi:MAG: ribonuclease H-like domain-containing protein [Acetobacterales bacterium]
MTINVHDGDIPDGLSFADGVAIDTETMGLNPHRDPLCVVQLSAGDGDCHVVRFPQAANPDYAAPRLKTLLADPATLKIFHFARFDVAVMARYLGVATSPVYCTKIASKLCRTYTDRHGLKDLCKELLGVDLSKQQQSSDWGASELSAEQLEYAANDVLHLHRLRTALDDMLDRAERRHLAEACFGFLPTRAALDLAGWPDIDIFAH